MQVKFIFGSSKIIFGGVESLGLKFQTIQFLFIILVMHGHFESKFEIYSECENIHMGIIYTINLQLQNVFYPPSPPPACTIHIGKQFMINDTDIM